MKELLPGIYKTLTDSGSLPSNTNATAIVLEDNETIQLFSDPSEASSSCFVIEDSIDEILHRGINRPHIFLVLSVTGLSPKLLDFCRLCILDGLFKVEDSISIIVRNSDLESLFDGDSDWGQTLCQWSLRCLSRRIEGYESSANEEIDRHDFLRASPLVLVEEATEHHVGVEHVSSLSLDPMKVLAYIFRFKDNDGVLSSPKIPYPLGGFLEMDTSHVVVTNDTPIPPFGKVAVGVDFGFEDETAFIKVVLHSDGLYWVVDSTSFHHKDVNECIEEALDFLDPGDLVYCDSQPKIAAKTFEHALGGKGFQCELISFRSLKGKMVSHLTDLVSMGRLRVQEKEGELLSEISSKESQGHYDRLDALLLACYALSHSTSVSRIKQGMIEQRARESMTLGELANLYPEVAPDDLIEIYWKAKTKEA